MDKTDKIQVELSLKVKQSGRERALKDGDVRAVFHYDLVLGSSEGNLDCVGGEGTTDQLVIRDWKRQMYEKTYVLGIHLGKTDVSFNEFFDT